MRWSSNFQTHSTCFHHWVTSWLQGRNAMLHCICLRQETNGKCPTDFAFIQFRGIILWRNPWLGVSWAHHWKILPEYGGASTRQNYWLMVGPATHSKMLHKPIYWHYHFHWILLSDITCCENDGPIQTYSEMVLCSPPKMGVTTYQDDLLSNQNGSKLMASNGFPSNKLTKRLLKKKTLSRSF